MPARRLKQWEIDRCRTRWSDLKLSYRERLLGLYIGVDATIVDQYAAPMEKFRRLVPALREAAQR